MYIREQSAPMESYRMKQRQEHKKSFRSLAPDWGSQAVLLDEKLEVLGHIREVVTKESECYLKR